MAGAISVLLRATVRTAVVLAVLVSTAAAQDAGSAQITGRAIDPSGAPLPGVRITATRDLVRKEATTGNDGGFAISGLAPATYDVRADLPGFETVSIRVPASASGVDNPLTIRMRVGCFASPGLEVIGQFDDAVKAADLVVRVRLDSIENYQRRVDDGYCGPITVFEATIRELVVNRRSQRPGPLRFVMLNTELAEFFRAGNDYIAFLVWHSGTSTYRTYGRSYLVPVRDGKVNLPGSIRESDQPLDKALAVVRALSGQR